MYVGENKMYWIKQVNRCLPSSDRRLALSTGSTTYQGSRAKNDDTIKTPYVAINDTTMCVNIGSPILRTAVMVQTTAHASMLTSVSSYRATHYVVKTAYKYIVALYFHGEPCGRLPIPKIKHAMSAPRYVYCNSAPVPTSKC